ncbi:protein TolR [Pseudidiomarina insulisalsae]|uniref:Tol-Pal system protein TolR n=1 Tax=Pseudidiomarina insulisalsae TaxID=575789 RepID=A0A432YLZ0_9GAMM|nr:protein TolR [Pseudidiomarina insulisalsae]RUO61952.1 protein TolR [Pseudidiomarina insulisalsae]
MLTSNRKRRKPVSEINVVPYIDVMLVLLIIFMVTAPLITQGVQVDLPNAQAEPLDKESKPPVIVSVNRDGQYFINSINNVGDPNEPLALETLAARIQAQLINDPQTRFMVNGDEGVSYNQVVQLMVLLQQLGIESVGLMTEDTNT